MASPRQAGKFPLLLPLLIASFGTALPSWPVSAADPGKQAAVIADYHTGLALAGYDPVAYFVEAKPVPGRANLEFTDARGVSFPQRRQSGCLCRQFRSLCATILGL